MLATVVQATAPVVHAVAPIVPAVVHHSLLQQINDAASKVPVFDITVAAGVLATGLQSLINKYKELGKLENRLLGLVGLPGLLTAGSAFLTANHFHWVLAPAVALVGQLLYAVIEKIKENTQKKIVSSEF